MEASTLKVNATSSFRTFKDFCASLSGTLFYCLIILLGIVYFCREKIPVPLCRFKVLLNCDILISSFEHNVDYRGFGGRRLALVAGEIFTSNTGDFSWLCFDFTSNTRLGDRLLCSEGLSSTDSLSKDR